MNKEEIMKILPHRDNMLLVEQAQVVDGVAHGKYAVRGDEWFLQGHFPGNPVVPGVILCEMMAQATCVLLAESLPEGATPYFTSLDKVKFKNPVSPRRYTGNRVRHHQIERPVLFCQWERLCERKISRQRGLFFCCYEEVSHCFRKS